MNSNKLLTVSELCSELHISKTTAYKMLHNKAIKSVKIGKKILITREDLTQYINSNIRS